MAAVGVWKPGHFFRPSGGLPLMLYLPVQQMLFARSLAGGERSPLATRARSCAIACVRGDVGGLCEG